MILAKCKLALGKSQLRQHAQQSPFCVLTQFNCDLVKRTGQLSADQIDCLAQTLPFIRRGCLGNGIKKQWMTSRDQEMCSNLISIELNIWLGLQAICLMCLSDLSGNMKWAEIPFSDKVVMAHAAACRHVLKELTGDTTVLRMDKPCKTWKNHLINSCIEKHACLLKYESRQPPNRD